MAADWIDLHRVLTETYRFLRASRDDMHSFARTVNQAFEAYVFASVVQSYRRRRYTVRLNRPDGRVRLKYSTRGRPDNYSYATVSKGGRSLYEIHHNLRVQGFFADNDTPLVSFVLDVAVVRPGAARGLSSDQPVDHEALRYFGEAKHMSAFAELVAGFIGLVHETMPWCIGAAPRPRRAARTWPFLFVSGHLNPTARQLVTSICRRGYDVAVYDLYHPLLRDTPALVSDPRSPRSQAAGVL